MHCWRSNRKGNNIRRPREKRDKRRGRKYTRRKRIRREKSLKTQIKVKIVK